jgi:large conductance mechanosensitive channel
MTVILAYRSTGFTPSRTGTAIQLWPPKYLVATGQVKICQTLAMLAEKTTAMFKEFKDFITRGNVLELAIGLIMATYFGAIVKSFVDDIIMPPIGQMIAGVDFSKLKMVIGTKMLEDGSVQEVAINYGNFLNTIITFFIVSLAVFIVVKAYNDYLKKKKDEPPVAEEGPTAQEQLLMEIRDAIKAQTAQR